YRARTAYMNAFTTRDFTHHTAVAPPQNLEGLLRQEQVRLSGDCGGITRADFEREREVVRQELRLSGSARHDRVPFIAAMYGDGHPYTRAMSDDEPQLDKISFEDACAFLARTYVPRRATLILGGNVSAEAAARLRDELLATLPDRPTEAPPA